MVTIIAEGPHGKRIAGTANSVEAAHESINNLKKTSMYRNNMFLIDTGSKKIEVASEVIDE